METELQYVLVYQIPRGFDQDEVFEFLGKKYPIVRQGNTFLSLGVPKEEAVELLRAKNSTLFNGAVVGLIFDKPPQPKSERKKKKVPPSIVKKNFQTLNQ